MDTSPTAALHSLDVFGFYLSPLALWAGLALLVYGAVRWGLGRLGAYRFVWHRALFDLAVYVIVLGGLIMLAGGGRWL